MRGGAAFRASGRFERMAARARRSAIVDQRSFPRRRPAPQGAGFRLGRAKGVTTEDTEEHRAYDFKTCVLSEVTFKIESRRATLHHSRVSSFHRVRYFGCGKGGLKPCLFLGTEGHG